MNTSKNSTMAVNKATDERTNAANGAEVEAAYVLDRAEDALKRLADQAAHQATRAAHKAKGV
jgi:hypothetical protein